uniref:Undecaprenyl-diphosphatase n=1 Tax=Thermosporothrix sp. COM3 TaxID=2490863 RepID=A0A455SG57_9CHLR|nr:undecaprenyl-diphosphatase [Thermosporothrix sp. COM3]
MLLTLNATLFHLVNQLAGRFPWLDDVMIFCAEWLIFCWPVLLLVLWGLPRRSMQSADEQQAAFERRSLVLWVAVACALAYGFNIVIGHLAFEERPFVAMRALVLVHHAADASFPSDHTAWSFAVVGMLLFALPRLFRLTLPPKRLVFLILLTGAFLVVGALVGFSRIFVGVHYPGDILGGICTGLGSARIVTWLRHRLERPTRAIIAFAHRCYLA